MLLEVEEAVSAIKEATVSSPEEWKPFLRGLTELRGKIMLPCHLVMVSTTLVRQAW